MKFSSIVAAVSLGASIASAHTIFQKVSVNGQEQANLFGVRAPNSNNPVQDVNSGNIACNAGGRSTSDVITIPAGASVGTWWQHVIGGAQGSNDADNPIAASHKGPFMVYLAKVSNAGSTGTSGLQWFKVYQDTLTSDGKWGVDRMISNNGWAKFTLPSCIAPGDYLMRAELLALHSATSQGGAQFYMSCANIRVTGSGSFKPSSTVSFPGAYKSNDPGILVSIYDQTGKPTNGGRAYQAPGPAPISC